MRALELQRREEERQSKLKSAAEAKAERQQKWEAMTEEEKEVFVQEEKIAKKQEWIKKQVGKLAGCSHQRSLSRHKKASL